MGLTHNCCWNQQQLINFDQLTNLDPKIIEQISQLRRAHITEIKQSLQRRNGNTIFRGHTNKNKLKEGYGELYKLNLSYFGEFNEDKPHGYGILVKGAEQYYKGQFQKGLYNGKGREFSQNHEFQGVYEDGYRKWGILRTSKFEYQGEFHKNLFEGHGNLKLTDGSSYDGSFKGGKYHGKGFLSFQNSNKYQGNFQNGKYHGSGKFIWADGVQSFNQYQKGERKQREFIDHTLATCESQFKNQNKGRSQPQVSKQRQWFDYRQIPKITNGDGMLNFY